MKRIKVDEEAIQKIIDDFTKYVANTRVVENESRFTYKISSPKIEGDLATIIFTEKAYAKMTLLIESFDCEVAWHGVAERMEKGKYRIEDILVYPQTVTGATVDTDTLELAQWAATIPNDIYNSLRFQGHSHVNMSTFSSSVDKQDRKKYLAQLQDDDFYIFGIFNKRGEASFEIYDLMYDTLYEDDDIDYLVEGEDVGEFLADAQLKVRARSTINKKNYYQTIIDEYYDEKEDEYGLQ